MPRGEAEPPPSRRKLGFRAHGLKPLLGTDEPGRVAASQGRSQVEIQWTEPHGVYQEARQLVL